MAAFGSSVSGINGHDAALGIIASKPPVRPRATACLILHSRNAQRLLAGRPASAGKPAIIGLFGFAERLREIWRAANQADLYAHWWLTKTEDVFEIARSKIELADQSIANILADAADLQIQVARSESPQCVDLRFACPYAFWGARLLKSFDRLALLTTTAEQLGLGEAPREVITHLQCERAIRRLFASPQGFHSLGLTATAIDQGGEQVRVACDLMGELPGYIHGGERRPLLLRTFPLVSGATAGIDT